MMRQLSHTLLLFGIRIGLAVMFLLSASAAVVSQTRPLSTPPDPPRAGAPEKDDLGSDIGSHESEMRAKLALRADKKAYEENLGRAREACEIATQLRDAYEAKKSFNSEDTKKLERMEKLMRRIRNEAGGSESDDDAEAPSLIEVAVKHLADLAQDLRKEVEKTPRHVVSTAVIDQANKVIGLIKHLRDLNR